MNNLTENNFISHNLKSVKFSSKRKDFFIYKNCVLDSSFIKKLIQDLFSVEHKNCITIKITNLKLSDFLSIGIFEYVIYLFFQEHDNPLKFKISARTKLDSEVFRQCIISGVTDTIDREIFIKLFETRDNFGDFNKRLYFDKTPIESNIVLAHTNEIIKSLINLYPNESDTIIHKIGALVFESFDNFASHSTGAFVLNAYTQENEDNIIFTIYIYSINDNYMYDKLEVFLNMNNGKSKLALEILKYRQELITKHPERKELIDFILLLKDGVSTRDKTTGERKKISGTGMGEILKIHSENSNKDIFLASYLMSGDKIIYINESLNKETIDNVNIGNSKINLNSTGYNLGYIWRKNERN